MSLEQEENKPDIDDLLTAIRNREDAAMAHLVKLIYPELKRLAHFQRLNERADHTLNTTAIVHEAYLRLATGKPQWNNRQHFLRAAAAVMRHLLVDHARRRAAAKRGDGHAASSFDEERTTGDDDMMAVLALENAIKDIATIDPRLEQVIECRYFAGLSVTETAEALGIAERTVARDWKRARGYLKRSLDQSKN